MTATAAITRGVVALAAVTVIGWLVVSLIDRYDLDHAATAMYSPARTRQSIQRGLAQAMGAGRLRPDDQDPSLTEGALLGLEGKRAKAISVLQRVVSREPANVVAWDWLAEIAGVSRPAIARHARGQLAKLDPMAARAAG